MFVKYKMDPMIHLHSAALERGVSPHSGAVFFIFEKRIKKLPVGVANSEKNVLSLKVRKGETRKKIDETRSVFMIRKVAGRGREMKAGCDIVNSGVVRGGSEKNGRTERRENDAGDRRRQ